MPVHKLKRRGRVEWRARVTRNGITKTAVRRRRDEALEAERELIDQLEGRTPEAAPGVTFAEHWQEYLRDVAKTRNKPSTLREKAGAYRVHLGPYFGVMRLDAIGTREIDRFRASLLERRSAKTTNNVLTILRHALAIAHRWDRIPAMPHVEWARVPLAAFRFLSFEEADRLVEAARALGPVETAAVVVTLHTGLRVGELRALAWDAVHLDAGRLHVRQAASRTDIGTPKSGRAREVPLSRTARAALEACPRSGPWVLGRLLTRHEADGLLQRVQRRAGITDFGWHALRHTFASHLVMRGVPLKAVQELLGHATIDMTMRYAHLSPDVRREAVEVLDR